MMLILIYRMIFLNIIKEGQYKYKRTLKEIKNKTVKMSTLTR